MASTVAVRVVAEADVAILQVLLLLTLVIDGADGAGRYAPISVMLTFCRCDVGRIDRDRSIGECRVLFPAKPLTCICRIGL